MEDSTLTAFVQVEEMSEFQKPKRTIALWKLILVIVVVSVLLAVVLTRTPR
jgi:hypothetical protein